MESEADNYKKQGNDAFKEQKWDAAIESYSKAIGLDCVATDLLATLYSNRAACFSSKGDHASALSDANMCIEHDASYIKGHTRKGKALFDMNKLDLAETAYNAGLEVDQSNDSCKQGLRDVQEARRLRKLAAERRAQVPASDPARPRSSEPTELSLWQKVVGKLPNFFAIQGSKNMTLCLLVAVGFYAYREYTPEGQEAKWPWTLIRKSNVTQAPPAAPRFKRGFTEVEGSWLSYMESPKHGDTMLLLLHRSPLSAEGEYGDILPELIRKAEDSPPRGGLWMLAPDRPCHGYSPCPSMSKGTGRSRDVAWLSGILSVKGIQPHLQKLVVVASGLEAGQQAFAFARKFRDAVHIMLISPSNAAKSPKRVSTGGGFFEWLQGRAAEMTLRNVADTAVFTANADAAAGEDFMEKATSAIRLPRGSVITLFYLKGDREVNDVTDDLGIESRGITVNARWSKKTEATAEVVIDEVWELMGADGSVAKKPVQEEDEFSDVDDSL